MAIESAPPIVDVPRLAIKRKPKPVPKVAVVPPKPATVAVSPRELEPRLVRKKMTREEYERLPEKPKAEWVNGEAIIMMAPANLKHSDTMSELIVLLKNSLPKLKVRPEAGFRYGQRDRVPDIMVVTPEKAGTDVWVTEAPEIIVEVISPGTRTQDLVTKSLEYLEAGVGQYWIVDPKLEAITILQHNDKAWDILAELDKENSEAEIAVGKFGSVKVNVAEVFA